MNKEEIKYMFETLTKQWGDTDNYVNDLLSYSKNLQQENQRLKEIEKEHQKMNGELREENQKLKKQLEYLRSGEYLNQLKFERDMLQNVVDNGEVSKEDKTFIDMTHRNTELLEVIEEVREYIEREDICIDIRDNELNYISTNDLLQILDKVKN